MKTKKKRRKNPKRRRKGYAVTLRSLANAPHGFVTG
jgi:hypothetical protein